jgi:hypothetical protein
VESSTRSVRIYNLALLKSRRPSPAEALTRSMRILILWHHWSALTPLLYPFHRPSPGGLSLPKILFLIKTSIISCPESYRGQCQRRELLSTSEQQTGCLNESPGPPTRNTIAGHGPHYGKTRLQPALTRSVRIYILAPLKSRRPSPAEALTRSIRIYILWRRWSASTPWSYIQVQGRQAASPLLDMPVPTITSRVNY